MTEYYDLLQHCKKGQPKAQRMLYDIFSAKLMGLCRRYTRGRDEAKDVLQESFIKIFTQIGQLESPAKLEAWMKTIAVHTAINHYHRTKRQESLFTSFPGNELKDSDETLTELEDSSDENLVALINDLPDGCRLIFNLYAVEGYSHQEIAKMLDVSEGTSRSQYHYAKSILRSKLNCQDLTHYYEKFA